MPVQVGKSKLFAKMSDKAAKAHNTHKGDDTTFGQAGLPAGIETGIAQLRQCKFGEYKDGDNKGQPFFMAAGIVKSPDAHEGTPIAGLRTQVGPEPLCDTPKASGKRKTFDDHYQWMLNELRKLGVDTKSISVDDLEATASQLEKDQPCFRFRTWKGSKQTTGPFAGREPRVQHEWNGVVEFSDEVSPEAGVEEDVHSANGDGGSTEPAAEEGEETLESLCALCDNEDEKVAQEAQTKLTQVAVDAGVDPKVVKNADNWADVVAMIEAAAPDGEGAAAASEPIVPVKGGCYRYCPLGKDKKPGSPVDVEATLVVAKSKICTLKNSTTKATYLNVKWEELLPPE